MLILLKVDNFKSLVNFSVNFHENNTIIGNNATGKSTILQAIDFLFSGVREDFDIILERRGWKVDNIKSKLQPKNHTIRFISEYLLEVDCEKKHYQWELNLSINKNRNKIFLQSEKVVADGKELLFYHAERGGYWVGNIPEQYGAYLPGIVGLPSSIMKLAFGSKELSKELKVLIDFLRNSSSFELLSPTEMRLSSRGNKETIGMSGKNLPSFIKNMDSTQKISFMKKLEMVLGGRFESVSAETKGKPGWTEIHTDERYANRVLKVTSKEMSDGMLRLLAFIAISEIQTPEALMMLDEVENGIDVGYAESLMRIMQKMYEEKRHQLIMTTHSTVFLDYVNAEDIIFLYRDMNGCTKAIHLFEDNYFKEKLAYMWPGEVILNTTQKELVEKVLMKQEGNSC